MRAATVRKDNAPLSRETLPDPECPVDGVGRKVRASRIWRSDRFSWTAEHPRVKSALIQGRDACGDVVAARPRTTYAVGDVPVARTVALPATIAQLVAFYGPTAAGGTVITDFTR
jgi:D-arabinose 1-dehydrogenase-like Zn-dependent alcohol dehydrogenase